MDGDCFEWDRGPQPPPPKDQCPDCKGKGLITLFISISTCKACNGRGTLSIETPTDDEYESYDLD